MHIRKTWLAAAASGLTLIGGFALATDGFSAWSSLLQEANPANSAVVQLQAGSSDTLSTAVSNYVPGDSSQSLINLSNSGTVAFSSVTMTSQGCAAAFSGSSCSTAPNALVTSASGGLQVGIDACSVAWTAATSNGATTYSCSGTKSTVMSQTAVASLPSLSSTSPVVLSIPGGTIQPGTQAYLRFTTTLPSSSPQSISGLSDYVQYGFTGIQPTAGSIG